MIHYHGTPITPFDEMRTMGGRHFCVSWASPQALRVALETGQSVLGDNGAFTWRERAVAVDWAKYYAWVDTWLAPPHWCVIPDVIGGTADQQRALVAACPLPRELAAPVWHLHLPLDYLLELSDSHPRVCFGSSAQYWQIGTPEWRGRIDTAFEALAKRRRFLPWIHMLRAMDAACDGPWPFASADSTNIARNYKQDRFLSAEKMADRIDRRNPKPAPKGLFDDM